MTSNNVYVAMNEAHDECYTRVSDALDMFRFVMRHVNLRSKVVWLPFNDDGKNIEKAAHSLKIYKTESGGVVSGQRTATLGYNDIQPTVFRQD